MRMPPNPHIVGNDDGRVELLTASMRGGMRMPPNGLTLEVYR